MHNPFLNLPHICPKSWGVTIGNAPQEVVGTAAGYGVSCSGLEAQQDRSEAPLGTPPCLAARRCEVVGTAVGLWG
jgi:hypothetical protein